MSLPDNCIKGIPKDSSMLVICDGKVSPASHLFHFPKNPTRNDGFVESSINWEDNDSVLEFTLNQRKESGEKLFPQGAVRILRDDIDRLNRRSTLKGIFSYERHPLENNPYHGNILLRGNLPGPLKRQAEAGLAIISSTVIPQHQN